MNKNLAKIFVSLLTVFTLNATAVPTSALDLGAKGQYIISVNPKARANIEAAITKSGWKINNKFQYAFDGYVVELPKVAAAALSKIPNILSIEEDQPVEMSVDSTTQSPTPSWGLDRIDQRGVTSGTSSYVYGTAGTGATIYIADTGIYPHNDVAGRLSSTGFTAIADGKGTVDCNGHGTHVAATAAGTKYGVAKNANLVPVRVLDCSGRGSYSGIISGLDWILSTNNTNSKSSAVVNMSLGGSVSTSLNSAVARLTSAGITVVVAAGNESTDACTRSPASAPSAITVGATTSGDVTASYSNQGSCVDLFAPGSSITSAWYTGLDATNTISGTSMASPHAAGVAAVYLGLNPGASAAQVSSYLVDQSTSNVISGIKASTVNKLLYVEPGAGSGTTPVTPPPTPTVTAPVVTVSAATNITTSAATLGGTVNAGNGTTTVNFRYGTSSDFVNSPGTLIAANPASVSGSTVTTVSANLTGLLSAKIYYYRVEASNSAGSVNSATLSFTTTSSPSKPVGGKKKTQTLTFPAIPDREFGPGYYLKATSTSGLTVTYKSLTPEVCVILMPTAGPAVQSVPGGKVPDRSTCTVEASQAGNDEFESAEVVTRSFLWIKAPMYITPYVAASSVRNAKLSPVTSASYATGATYNFVSSLLFTSGNNSGLLSIGHLLRAETQTSTVCSVTSVATQDRTGGIFTMAQVKMLQKGTCTIRWSFDGTDSRGAATADMSVNVSK